MTEIEWPTTGLGPVQRLRALAAGVRGALVTERAIRSSPERVWELLSDLEGEFGAIQPDMHRVTILSRNGDSIEALARSRYGMRALLRGTMTPGWCWLQSRFLLIGMAVAEGPDGTSLVAMTGGIRIPGRAALVPIGVRAEAAKSLDRLRVRLDARG